LAANGHYRSKRQKILLSLQPTMQMTHQISSPFKTILALIKSKEQMKVKQTEQVKNAPKKHKKATKKSIRNWPSLEPHRTPIRNELRINWPLFIQFFNNTLDKYNSAIPRVHYLSIGQKAWIQRLVNAMETKELVVYAIEEMAQNDTLNGRNPRVNFVASLIWLFHKEEHFEKVVNGYYYSATEIGPTPQEIEEQKQKEKAEELKRKRAEIQRIDEENHERLQQQIREREANAPTLEELKEIWKKNGLPPLRPEEGSQRAH